MTTPNILTDTTPVVDPEHPASPNSVITDAWGLFFAQGGVVMAAALRAMALVLDRPDLRLTSASAAFCRPVACGPVTTDVTVLRNGRKGAQVHGALRDQSAEPGTTSVTTTAVFTDPNLDGPTLAPLPRPAELLELPSADSHRSVVTEPSRFPLGFLQNTEWRVASSPHGDLGNAGPIPRLALWFRFNSPPAADGTDWEPALLPIPGDSLGSALAVAFGDGKPVGSVSLQIDLQVHAPVTGTWIGIDSTCTNIANGLAFGVLHLWTEDGIHAATVSQTAMLRSLT